MADYVGRQISPGQRESLRRYQEWLEGEAVPAGGLGPAETHRLEDRHIADSLLFYAGWDHPAPPGVIWDLGTGVGLPGIPLAVLLPETETVLVDRSGARVDLAKRAVRVLGLDNVTVLQREIGSMEGEAPMLVARALASPPRLDPVLRKHLAEGGRAVLGGSWIGPPEDRTGWEVKEIPRDLLDRPVWLLIMRA
ncbi:MAG: class I SAM-dependent methyltransferase [Actinobacteria bacterium]|nr:class I SAM-dependent methyltransferase [Actinomycetota bacterium]